MTDELVIPSEPEPFRTGLIKGPDGRPLSRVTVHRATGVRLRRLDETGTPVGEAVEVAASALTEIERDPADDETPIDLGPREFTVSLTYELTPELRRLVYGELWTPP